MLPNHSKLLVCGVLHFWFGLVRELANFESRMGIEITNTSIVIWYRVVGRWFGFGYDEVWGYGGTWATGRLRMDSKVLRLKENFTCRHVQLQGKGHRSVLSAIWRRIDFGRLRLKDFVQLLVQLEVGVCRSCLKLTKEVMWQRLSLHKRWQRQQLESRMWFY